MTKTLTDSTAISCNNEEGDITRCYKCHREIVRDLCHECGQEYSILYMYDTGDTDSLNNILNELANLIAFAAASQLFELSLPPYNILNLDGVSQKSFK